MLRRLLFLTILFALSAVASLAQDEDVLATGLNNPRNLFLGEDGTLYIAESGVGGNVTVEGPYGPATAGLTAQVSALTPDGEWSVVVPELVSMDAGFGMLEGAMAVHVTGDSYWVVLGMGMSDDPFEGSAVESVVQIDRGSGEVLQTIDFGGFERAENPDETIEVVSNPADLAIDADGKLYVVDASANTMLTWTEADGIQLVTVWPSPDDQPQAVPSAVDIGPDGDIYVGFLSGFPFLPGTARIERYSPDGELKQTYSGLTLVTDIIVTEAGDIYAVELASGFGDMGYISGSGRIVQVTEDDLEVIAEGLNYPYGFALEADGSFIVTIDSAFGEADSGRIIRVAGM